jgi:hypothetical protein
LAIRIFSLSQDLFEQRLFKWKSNFTFDQIGEIQIFHSSASSSRKLDKNGEPPGIVEDAPGSNSSK